MLKMMIVGVMVTGLLLTNALQALAQTSQTYYLEPPSGTSLIENEPVIGSGVRIDLWLYSSGRTWTVPIVYDLNGDQYYFSFYLAALGSYTVDAEIVLNPGAGETILAQTQFFVSSSTYTLFTDTITGLDPDIPSGGDLAVRLASNTGSTAVALMFSNGNMPYVEVPPLLCEVMVEPMGVCDGMSTCYSVIQNAIDGSDSGCIIKVAEGTYTENIIIEDGVTLELAWDSSFTTLDQPNPVELTGI